jgi:CDP-diacylglycerol--glycerol-3-phosphate 3-phosphatidyltransferase
MSATHITLVRFPLLLGSVLALYVGAPGVRLAAVGLLFVGLMLDTVDGIVARRKGQASLFGGVLDIAADRTYELVLWVSFADLRLIPSWVPLVIIARTTITDAVRSLGVAEGAAPFEQPRTALARFLVASPAMRIAYQTSKVATFCGLALLWTLASLPSGSAAHVLAPALTSVLQVTLYLAVLLCVVRGLPVVLEVVGRGSWAGCHPERSEGT